MREGTEALPYNHGGGTSGYVREADSLPYGGMVTGLRRGG